MVTICGRAWRRASSSFNSKSRPMSLRHLPLPRLALSPDSQLLFFLPRCMPLKLFSYHLSSLVRHNFIHCGSHILCQGILEEYAKTEFDPHLVEGAKSAVIFSLVSEVDTVPLAADNAFLTYLSQTPTTKMIEDVLAVKPEDLSRVLKSRLIHLFDSSKAITAVAVNPGKIDDTKVQFSTYGLNLEVIDDIELFLTS